MRQTLFTFGVLYASLMLITTLHFVVLPQIGYKNYSMPVKLVGIALAPFTIIWLVLFYPRIESPDKEV